MQNYFLKIYLYIIMIKKQECNMKKVYVKEFCKFCMTQTKAKNLYEYLRSLNTREFEIDFSDVEYVSASFLDESVWKLAEENYKITIPDPDKVIEPKLNKIKEWTQSNIQIKKHDRHVELAYR